MANRKFEQFQGSVEKGLVHLFAAVSVASGTPTLKQWNPPGSGSAGSYTTAPSGGYAGIKSVATTAAGAWTVTLQDPYVRFLEVRATFHAASGATAAPLMSVVTTGTDVTTSTGGVIKLLFQATAAGGGVDPTDGYVYLHIVLQNSSARS